METQQQSNRNRNRKRKKLKGTETGTESREQEQETLPTAAQTITLPDRPDATNKTYKIHRTKNMTNFLVLDDIVV